MRRPLTARLLQCLVLAGTLLVLPGCFEITNRLVIQDAGSGTWSLTATADFAQSLPLSNGKISSVEQMRDALRERIGPDPKLPVPAIPEGLSWEDGTIEVGESTATMTIVVDFRSLVDLRQPFNFTGGPAGSQSAVGSLQSHEQGKKIAIEGSPTFALELKKTDREGLADSLDAKRMHFELVAPDWKIKKSDAHSRDGDVLRWSWSVLDLVDPPAISVLYKR